MSVRINLEIGHEAAIRSKRTIEGFTHDWEIYVKGCDNADIQYYVEKVVFHLHSTFTNPKRVIKEPPYKLRESGYAGFTLPIDIYLRNNEEPKKIRFTYDLNLQTTAPVVKVQKEKYVFYNPNEDFRRKLMKGGAVESGSSSDTARDLGSTSDKLKIKSNNTDLVKKHRIKEHKPEDTFTDLFGTPFNKTSKIYTEVKPPIKNPEINNQVKPDKSSNPKKSKSKHSPKEKERDKEKKEKNPDEKKKHKEEKRSKDRSKDKERKDKSSKREKSPKPQSESPNRSPKQRPISPKRLPSPKRPPSPPIKIKEEKKDDLLVMKEKNKSESKKIKHEQKDKEKDKEKKEHKSYKEKDISRNSEQKEHKIFNKEIKPLKEPLPFKNKEKIIKEEQIIVKEEKIEKPKVDKIETVEKVEKIEKPKHKHKKKDSKEKKEKKEDKSKEKKSEKKNEKSEFLERVYKEEPKVSPNDVEKNSISKNPETSTTDRNINREKSRGLPLQDELLDDSSNSSINSVDETIEVPTKKEQKKKDKTKLESAEKKRKRKNDESNNIKEDGQTSKNEEPATKITKNDSDSQIKEEMKTDEISEEEVQEMPLNYMNMLRELQHKIMTLQDNNELQQVVQLIAETGQFEITAQTFDFDLCTLDRNTVQKLQEFFAIS